MLTHARNPYLEDTLSQKLYGCPRTYRVQLDSDTTDFAINKINERNFFPRDVTLKDIGLLVGAPKDSQLAFTYFSPISENGRDTFLITASYELVTPLETHDDISYLRNTCTLSRGFDKWTDAYKDLTCSIERIEISHSIKGHPYSLDGITQNGVGSRVLALQVEALRYFGVTEIKAKGLASEQGAPRMGYYALPRLGFDGKIPKWLIHEEIFQESPFRYERNIRDIFRIPGGKEWWQKFGTTLDLQFDLSPHSVSSRTMQNYQIEKGILLPPFFDRT